MCTTTLPEQQMSNCLERLKSTWGFSTTVHAPDFYESHNSLEVPSCCFIDIRNPWNWHTNPLEGLRFGTAIHQVFSFNFFPPFMPSPFPIKLFRIVLLLILYCRWATTMSCLCILHASPSPGPLSSIKNGFFLIEFFINVLEIVESDLFS